MLLKVKRLYLIAGRPIAILHQNTAKWLNLHVGERIKIAKYNDVDNRCIFSPIDITGGNTILNTDEIAISQEIVKELDLKKREVVDVSPGMRPLSVEYIKKKLNGKALTFTEIFSIISDIVNNKLTEIEIAYFVAGVYEHDLNFKETIDLTKAILKTGNKLNLNKKIIIDKHSIGGVEGNRTTPIVVSIIGAAIDKFRLNAAMPKTSSRAITSAAGTADVVETICKVEFSLEELKKIVEKTNACMVWGGSLGLAPADDKLIQVERILALDPKSQLLASILSKKLAVGATHLLIDISYGFGSKMSTIKEAKNLKKKFDKMARVLGINLRVVLTKGDEPIGNGIGASLEMRDIISILKQEKNRSIVLENRSTYIASELLSLVLGINSFRASKIVKDILLSGIAWSKFKEIIKAQSGNPDNFDECLALGEYKSNIYAKKSGKIEEISNRKLSRIARLAGSPADRGAGIYIHKHLHEHVKKNEVLFTIYAETKEKLVYAKKIVEVTHPFLIH
jgi:AMP phosphorylase